jgi:hypothetical protein
MLYADVSEHCSIFIGGQVWNFFIPIRLWRWSRQRTSAYKIQTLENYPEEIIQRITRNSPHLMGPEDSFFFHRSSLSHSLSLSLSPDPDQSSPPRPHSSYFLKVRFNVFPCMHRAYQVAFFLQVSRNPVPVSPLRISTTCPPYFTVLDM